MARIYVGIGSNIDREQNVTSGLAALEGIFGRLDISSVFATTAVGFDGADFYNLVVGFDSDETPEAIVKILKTIESDHGRKHDEPKFSGRSLDLDLLTCDDRIVRTERISIPREDILKYAFVLKPLAEIAPDTRHPETGETYRELWNAFTGKDGLLRDVSHLFKTARKA